jgi:alkanesulfonate monooxygenase SsuD/methylene tetrahydromethanopterin reductase-like flavin-dependent oxidoreductase (luciferase family)
VCYSAALDPPRVAPMPRPLRVGVQLPEVERIVRWPEYEAMARAAEEVGFDSIWVGDHLLYREDDRPERGPWDAWTVMAALAGVTERVVIGPLVACLGFHPPGLVARMAAAIDEISGGRFVLGVGSGWNEPEFRAFGLPFDHRASRFLESFEIIRRLLAGERVTSEGRFWQVEDAVLLPPPARVTPVMLGTSGPRQLAATLPYAGSWNTWWDAYGNSADGFVVTNAKISAIAESAGRDPAEVERSACVLVSFDPTAGERPHEEDAPPLTGSPATIAQALRDLAEAGAHEAILVLDPINETTVRQCGDVLAALDA